LQEEVRMLWKKTARASKAWERVGVLEPYYGVNPERKHFRRNLDQVTCAQFFRTGEQEVEQTLRTIRERFGRHFPASRVLEYGCGVGRVLLTLARHNKRVVACDVSPSMLREAKINCERHGLTNVSFAIADDHLSAVDGAFDLIYSDGVFQHINPKRVDVILRSLLSRLDVGGIGVLGFVIDTPVLRSVARWLKRSVPLLDRVVTGCRGLSPRIGVLESHVYPLERVAQRLLESGLPEMSTVLFKGAHVTRARVFVQRAVSVPHAREEGEG
jgi:2-polyprenyl-3-methyl-5-hydroxy-6-metoxy-1,4-benzoquinol methylase